MGAILGVSCSMTVLAGCGDPVVVLGDWPGTMRIVAGVPNLSGSSVDSLATRTRLTTPRGVAVDDDGVLYVVDQRARILAVYSSGEVDVLVDHSICREEPCLKGPDGMVLDGKGGLIVADPTAARVWRLNLASGSIEVVAGDGTSGNSPDGTPALDASLYLPTGVAVTSDGRICFTERFGNRVRVIEDDGLLSTLAGTGDSGFAGDGGPAAAARLRTPMGLVAGGGTLYIADTGNQRIRKVDLQTGIIETVAGDGYAGDTGDNGRAIDARLNAPEALAISNDMRTLFIGDANNHRVRVVNLETGIITTFAGTGHPVHTGGDNMAAQTAIRRPGGLVVSKQHMLFVSDGNHIVWRTPIRF